ncbi:kinesin-like protein KIF12 isoform X2 [Clavelina lepadiformis]|uniref:kinesin-like protein KIF12 isoform X2 n=1 Tax=Clavelina lepadiformis TaxID=159417 RepID=UPI0040427C1A
MSDQDGDVIDAMETNDVEQKSGNFSVIRSSSSDSDKDGSTVHVVVRVRPLNPSEESRRDKTCAQFPGNGSILVSDNQSKVKTFSFHGVFEPGCTQEQVFENSGMKHLLDMALDGFACTAFAFGQTGSGKTYTMTGPVTPENRKQNVTLREARCYGLIQFSFAYLMGFVARRDDASYSIRASYLEIYNEQVQDLLNPAAYEGIQIRWSKSMGFYVENLFVREIENLEELMEVLEDGMKNRAVAEHNINDHSSRSHSVLTVYLDSEMLSEGMTLTKHGKVSFVDLAGSEKVKDTGSTGDTLLEATNINRSLLTLDTCSDVSGNCISALSDPKKRSGHIPFRDSKLTKLLADGLGGSGVTLMIACVTPSSSNLSETINTLRYAKRARKIKNKPVIRIDPREQLILKLQHEMNLLKQENKFLRSQLDFPQRDKPRFPHPNSAEEFQKRLQPQDTSHQLVSKSPGDRSASDNSLYGMLQEYMVENEALRNENQSLLTQHSTDEREQRMISVENDKLTRKLEDLGRLMMSSPLYTSSFLSRTNSGRSNQSFQSFPSSMSPMSLTSFSLAHGYGPTIPSHVAARKAATYGPVVAWNSTPVEGHPHNAVLPPLRGSPEAKKAPIIKRGLGLAGHPSSKWVNAASYATYASQFKRKQTHHRPPVALIEQKPQQKSPDDIMRDFPMKDYEAARSKRATQKKFPLRLTKDNSHVTSMKETSTNKLPVNFRVQVEKSGFYPVVSNPHGGALPDDAYKAQEISPRSKMKELSATSLRKLNDRMRREMRALDDEINSYQKSINQSKKKIPVT